MEIRKQYSIIFSKNHFVHSDLIKPTVFSKGFLPISKNAEVIQWVKTYIMSQKQTRQELAAELFEELRMCLKGCTERDASLFVLQLTGYQRVGFTKIS
ncbi:hypothetical protein AAAC51_20810 [Priestia megaterium]